MRHVYTSVDIGSDNIKVVVCELYKGRYNLLAASSVKSKGIKKGLISDVNEASISISEAFKEVESMLGFKIKQAIAIVPSYFADFNMIKGEIKIDREDKKITGEDIIEVLNNAMQEAIVPNKEMVTIMPIDFETENGTVKEPQGMISSYLKTRAIMVTVPKKNIYSVVSILKNVGIETIDVSLGCIGDIYSFRNSNTDSGVGVIINVGAEVTSVSLYNKGIVIRNSIINMGSHDVDNDIVYMYKTDNDVAVNLKEKFALAHKKGASANEFKEIINKKGEKFKINQYELTEVVQARLEEILTLAHNEINNMTNKKLDYIILTGGITNLNNFSDVSRDIFGNCVIIGSVNLTGLRNNKYSQSIGNIIYFVNKLRLKGKNYSMISSDDVETLSSPKKTSTMLGKVFGYFFGE